MIKLFRATLTGQFHLATNEVTPEFKLFVLKINCCRNAQRGARTHDPEIKSLMLYRLS